MSTVIWKPIPNSSGMYDVSNTGQVRRNSYIKVKDDGSKVEVEEKVLPICDNGKVCSVNFNKKTYILHLLVAKAFKEDADCPSRIRFIDGDHRNCNVDNLEWASLSSITKAMIAEGKKSNPAPYTGIKLQCKETGQTYSSIKELCDELNIPRSYVTKCIYSKDSIKGLTYEKCKK